MQYFHFVKILGFLSSWTLLYWIFFADEKNISNQVRNVIILKDCFSKQTSSRFGLVPMQCWAPKTKNWVCDREQLWSLAEAEVWTNPPLLLWSNLLCQTCLFNFGKRTKRKTGFRKLLVAGGIESNPTTSVIIIAQKLPVSPKFKKDFFKNFCLSLNFGRRCFQMYHCWHILCFYLANVSFTKFSNVLVHQVSKCFWPEIQLQILATIWHTQVAFITTLAIFIVTFFTT